MAPSLFQILLLITPLLALVYARNYIHTPAEIKLVHHVTISQPNCARNETPIFIHTAAVSSGKYYERRMVIRRTWGPEATAAGMRVIFVLGVPRNLTTRAEIRAEAAEFGDILQFGFLEAYFNITLKAIGELNWAWRHCNETEYLLRVDDDVLVNVPRLSALIESRKINSGLTGQVDITEAHRETDHKWYMPPQYYHCDSYEFLKGYGYLLSIDRLKKLIDSMVRYRGYVLDIDDVWVTGIIADYGKIDRHHCEGFRLYCGDDSCIVENNLVMHGCKDSRKTELMYTEWKKMDYSRGCTVTDEAALQAVQEETAAAVGNFTTENLVKK